MKLTVHQYCYRYIFYFAYPCMYQENTIFLSWRYTKKKVEKVVSLEFAMDGLFVDSETGKKDNYPRFYRQMLERLAKEQRKFSRKRKGSSNWNKQHTRVISLHQTASSSPCFLYLIAKAMFVRCYVEQDVRVQALRQVVAYFAGLCSNTSCMKKGNNLLS